MATHEEEEVEEDKWMNNDYVVPSIAFCGIGMTVAGFSYGLRRQTRKLRKEEESVLKEGTKSNLSRRRKQQMEEMSKIRSTENVGTPASPVRRKRSRVRRQPPPKDLTLNPTRSALKALAYGSVLAWGGALFVSAFTAWYLDVRTFTEFGEVMKHKSRGVGPYLRNVFSLRTEEKKNVSQNHGESSSDLSKILLEAASKEKGDRGCCSR